MKNVAFTITLILAAQCLPAQVQNSGWLASFNTFKLNDKLSLHAEVQVRSGDKLETVQTLLLRPAINYHFNKKLSASFGYGYISNRRTIGNVSGHLGEHRLWQQLMYHHKISTVFVTHRFRFEERFLPNAVVNNNEIDRNGTSTAYRFRYFTRNIIPFSNKPTFTKGIFAAVQEEIFLNVGNTNAVNGKIFDQNRLYLSLGYRFASKIDVDAGYINQYVGGRTEDLNNHIIQIAVYKRL